VTEDQLEQEALGWLTKLTRQKKNRNCSDQPYIDLLAR
jgi:hypothetical protein